MNDTTTMVRQHYGSTGLTARIEAALAAITPGIPGDHHDHPLTVAQLAPLDQFHVRGILATAELAGAAGLAPSSHVLDLGCGLGGPARYLAATFGCKVTGVDLSPAFIEAATYLTARCRLSDRVTFEVGNALEIPHEAETFDAVFLQHVAMNIEDRAALHAEVSRVLAPGGRLAIHDVVLREGHVVYPVPWAREASTSFVRTEADTRAALEQAGFEAIFWQDDTQAALDWFAAMTAGPPPKGPSLGVVMGPDFPVMAGNLARNIRENRLGVLSAVLIRNGGPSLRR